MKKLIVFFAAVFMLFGLTACSGTQEDALIMGFDENFPPMGFRGDDGEYTGFDIELAKAVSEKIGVEIKFQPIDWSSKELELNSDKVDILWNGLTITDERMENMEFTKPYLKNKQIILVKTDSDIKAKADLAGKNIGIQSESSAVNAVNSDPIAGELILNEYPDNIAAFTDLDIGRVDAVVVDEIVAKYYLAHNDTKFAILDENFGDEEYGIAVKKGNVELVQKIQSGLDEISQDGTAAQLSQKYFGEDIFLH